MKLSNVDKIWGELVYHVHDIGELKFRHLLSAVDSVVGIKWPSSDTIEDGYGGAWSAWCPECGRKTMQIMRPGKVQCANCG